MAELICRLTFFYVVIVFARILLSWFPLQPGGLAARAFTIAYALTEPVLGPLRRTIPSVGMFDFSPLVVIFGQQILCTIISG